MSLRSTHCIFLLIIVIAADMFGGWAVYQHNQTGDLVTLSVGILSFLIGFAVIFYAIWLVRKLDKAHVE